MPWAVGRVAAAQGSAKGSDTHAEQRQLRGGVVSGESGSEAGFCWAALVARVLHPMDVQIIEAMERVGEPLSADDLTRLFDGKPSWALMGRHMRRLTKLEAVELAETPTTRNITDIRYRLVRRPRPDG